MKKAFFFSIFLMILAVILSFIFYLWQGKKGLEKTQTALLAADFSRSQALAEEATLSFQEAKKTLALFPFLGKAFQVQDWVEVGESLSQTAFYLARTGASLTRVDYLIFGREQGSLTKYAQEAEDNLGLAWKELSLLEAKLKKVPLIDTGSLRQKIEIGKKLLSVTPEIFAATSRKTYLFLLQNNMELRPTGGFIGSFALATFQNGQLLDFQVQDVYEADGQLRGHVEPPAAIKKYLGEAGWYLRDSNFDPDFPRTAEKAAWFLQKETGQSVDGVIAVNLLVIEKILQAIGSVELPDYQEAISAHNLFERAEYHSEVGFFPGSTQKKDFLSSLTRQLFEKIKNGDNFLKLAAPLLSGLEEKQILIQLNDQKVMSIISDYGWDGRLLANHHCVSINRPLGESCLEDYLMVVESNFGVNKTNFFLQRSFTHQVEIKETIEETLTIDYQNDSPTQTWPGGTYKNYLRVYTPLQSQLLSVFIDDQVLDLEKVDHLQESEKKVFGFLVEVPPAEKRKVKINYQLPFTAASSLSYSLLFQKQPGVSQDPLVVLIRYPKTYQASQISPQALTGPQSILYNTDLLKDRLFSVNLSR